MQLRLLASVCVPPLKDSIIIRSAISTHWLSVPFLSAGHECAAGFQGGESLCFDCGANYL